LRCAAITKAGERCQGTATGGAGYCFAHDPARASERKRNARRGGSAGGNGRPGTPGVGDVAQVRQEIRGVIGGVLKGTIHRSTGGVLFQGFNTLLRGFETERKIREQDELEDRIAELERIAGPEKGGRTWGA